MTIKVGLPATRPLKCCTMANHSSRLGLPMKGRHTQRTSEPNGVLRPRSNQSAWLSSEIIKAGLVVVSNPASAPPVRRRDTSTDKRVVFPIFQRLVRRVIDPKAMNPCQRQPGNSLHEFAISS